MVFARYKAVIAYDGSAFSGMQRQTNSRSVQAVIEEALKTIGWQENAILVAGRTDAGVHASGQVIAFDLAWNHTPQELQQALNAKLPEDVAVAAIDMAKVDFHPRFDAKSRRYEYRIFGQPTRDPLRERYAWRVWPAVNLDRLSFATRPLVGEHDFAAFGSAPVEDGGTIRRVLEAQWQSNAEDEFMFSLQANAFLYHMVRHLVGLLVKVGQGSAELNVVEQALSESSAKVNGLAPPQGLCLVAVEY